MKVTREQYNSAMTALEIFSQAYPLYKSKASYVIGTKEHEIDNAINVLSYSAGMWAACEKTHYTITQYNAALAVINREIGDYEYIYPVTTVTEQPKQPKQPKCPAQQAKSPENRKARKAAARVARYENDLEFRATCDKYGTRPTLYN